MISFIIIGRNEGWRLKKCMDSIFMAIEKNNYSAEVIYVDSQSTDGSTELAKNYQQVKVFVLTGEYNAAIARNVGAQEAKGDSLLFMDGDMEINDEFLPLIIDEKQHLRYDFVSGNFMNYYYDMDWNYIRKDFYQKIFCAEDTIQYTTGGLFAIKKSIWDSVGGMNSKFKKGQDLDLGYRLAKKKVFLLRKKERMANHHTVDYKDEKRLWNSFLDGSHVFPRAVLYRDHLLNKYVVKRFLSSDPTLGILVSCAFVSIGLQRPEFMLFYVIMTVLAVLISMRKTGFKGWLGRILNQILRDVFNVFAFLFFFPSNKKEIAYKSE